MPISQGELAKRHVTKLLQTQCIPLSLLLLQLLTDVAVQRVYEREGRDAVLECPTNAYSGYVKCTFTHPNGDDYLMVGR